MLVILSIVSILNAFIIVSLGQYILMQNSKNPLNRVFAILCINISAWAFVEFMYRQSATAESAAFWVRLIDAIWPFAPAVALHFALLFAKKKKWLRNPLTYFVLYLPSVLIAIVGLTTNLISSGPVKRPWGFEPEIPENSIYFALAGSWIILLAVAAIVIILRYRSRTTNANEKKQALLIALGLSIPLIAGAFSEVILPVSGIVVPPLTVNYMIGLIALTAYAVSRYGLFVLSPEAAAQNIIATMSEALLIAGPKGKILNFNKAMLNMLGYTGEELKGKPFTVLADKETLSSLNDAVPYDGPPLQNFEAKLRKKNGETIDALISISAIRDRSGGLAGFVGTAIDITELKIAREMRGIADYLQEALLELPSEIKGIDFGYLYHSATEQTRVGGDFFDLFELADDKVGIVVGDVSGKGIEAAALTSLIKDSIKAYIFLGLSPNSVMSKTNEVVARTTELETFATLFLGVLNTRTGNLIYCNAGHMPGIVKSAGGIKLLEPNSSLIGFFVGQHYMSQQAQMNTGDILVLYTDGITEARHDKEFYGEERLIELVAGAQELAGKEFPGKILEDVARFSHEHLVDDIAILTVSLETKQQKAAA